MEFKLADRLRKLPPYLFARIDELTPERNHARFAGKIIGQLCSRGIVEAAILTAVAKDDQRRDVATATLTAAHDRAKSGIYNVRINLGDVPDPADRANFERWCNDLQSRSVAKISFSMSFTALSFAVVP